jgi:hypothetical protein
MADLNFPQNPNPGDTYSIGTRTWIWNGSGWALQSGIISTNPFTVVSAIITTTTNSTSTTSGAIVVAGGGGFGGDIYAADIYSNGSQVITTASIGNFGVSAVQAGTDTAVANLLGNVVLIWNTSTLETVTSRGATSTNAITIADDTQSTGTTTGALVVAGGIGIGGNIYAGEIYDSGNRLLTSVTPVAGAAISITSVSTSTGTTSFTINNTGVSSLTGSASLGVSTSTGDITLTNLGVTDLTGTTYLGVSTSTGSVTLTNLGVQTLTAGTDTAVSGSTGTITVWNTSTLQSVTERGATTNQVIQITNATGASTTTDGALVVTGGVGIGQNLWVGGNANIVGRTTFSNEVVFNGTATFVLSTNTVYTDNILELHTTSTNAPWAFDDGKDIGLRFHYYNRTLDTGTNAGLVLSNQSQFLEWYGSGAEGSNVFAGDYGTFRTGEIRLVSAQANAQNTTTGALQVQGGVAIGANAYILGTGATASSTATAQQSLVVAANGIGINGDSYFANQLGVGGTLTASSAQVTNNFTVTGQTTLNGAVTANGSLGVAGNFNATGTTTLSGITSITDTTDSASTNSGALVVSGGLGIGGNVTVGGDIFVVGVINATVVGSISTATHLAGGATGAIPYQTSFGRTSFINPGASGTVLTSLGTGAQPQYQNTLDLAGDTQSTSTTSGALTVAGGVGIGKDLWVGGDLYTSGQLVITTATVNNFANQTFLFAGTDTAVSTSTGNITVWNISTLQSVTDRGATTTNVISIANTTQSTGTDTGALVIAGGAGINGNVTVGGDLTVIGTIAGTATINDLIVNNVSDLNGVTAGVVTASSLVINGLAEIDDISVNNTATLADLIVNGITNLSDVTAGVVTASSLSVTGTSVTVDLTVNNTATVSGTVRFGAVGEIGSNASVTATSAITILADSFVASEYRTVKYLAQVVDSGVTPHKVYVAELLVFHDDNGASTIPYIVQYGLGSNTGELGTWDAIYFSGNIELQFTPNYTPTSMRVKIARTGITT